MIHSDNVFRVDPLLRRGDVFGLSCTASAGWGRGTSVFANTPQVIATKEQIQPDSYGGRCDAFAHPGQTEFLMPQISAAELAALHAVARP
ncbi:hypothetical protein [Bradyrhizobium uaiense]|uniref:hypothetical protein n=1 Tax=Bradyrhizobium uaiense TaxID=2594946 RepID=UPI0013D6292F|nr:hypothetical protein [Bradyrhizobium uaiense]